MVNAMSLENVRKPGSLPPYPWYNAALSIQAIGDQPSPNQPNP